MNAKQSYRESSVAGSGPVRLVVLLYEQAIEDLRRASAAQIRGDVEGRTREINHALLVIGHLEGSLDKNAGAKVAENLQKFYGLLRMNLITAQCQQSPELLEKQIEQLIEVRDAWLEVERTTATAQASPGTDPKTGDQQRPSIDWKV